MKYHNPRPADRFQLDGSVTQNSTPKLLLVRNFVDLIKRCLEGIQRKDSLPLGYTAIGNNVCLFMGKHDFPQKNRQWSGIKKKEPIDAQVPRQSDQYSTCG